MIADELLRLHDEYLLRFVQEVFYPHPVSVVIAMFVILACLPSHRRFPRVLSWVAVCWIACCLLFYGMFRESPAVTWFLLGLLAYRFLCWVLWAFPSAVSRKPWAGWWRYLHPQAAWTTVLVRDYFRADPRGVYWLDLARAVRGMKPHRTPGERKATVLATPDLPAWRLWVWRRILALVEARIWLYGRLPRWWHRAQIGLELDEPHIRTVLQEESDLAYRGMLRSWTGKDFAEYASHDPKTRRRQEHRAGQYGRKSCLHREAVVEAMTFSEHWKESEPILVTAAWYAYLTWRRRSQFDMLWFRDEAVSFPADEDIVVEQAAPATAASPQEVVGTDDLLEPKLPERHENESPDEATAVPDVLVVDLGKVSEEEIPSTPKSRREINAEEMSPAAATAVAVEIEGERQQEELTDEELFATQAFTEESERLADALPEAAYAIHLLSPRQQERLVDLQSSSRMLEANLGISSSGRFSDDVQQVERLLSGPRQMPALVLLVLYCLRADYAGPVVDQLKVELLRRLDSFLYKRELVDEPLRKLRQTFLPMYIDVLFERREFGNVVELLRQREGLGKHEWKVLADAEVAVANHLRGQEELRDMLQYDAIGHYFQAGFRGIWTIEYSRTLVEHIHSAEELMELFRQHPVGIARPGTLSLGAPQPARVPTSQVAQSPVKVQEGCSIPSPIIALYSVGNRTSARQFRITLPFLFGQGNMAKLIPNARIASGHVKLDNYRGKLGVFDVSQGEGIKVNGHAAKACIINPGDRVQFGNVIMEVVSL